MTPENARWAVEENCVEGEDHAIFDSFTMGSLEMVTGGSFHPEEHLATAVVHFEANEGSVLTMLLRTLGDKWDPQSHRAELSGHFAVVTVLEMLEAWATSEGINCSNSGSTIG